MSRPGRTGRFGIVEGMTRGLPPAPRWAWIVMTLGVVAIVVLSYFTLNRPPPPGFTAPASAATTETPEPTEPAPTPASGSAATEPLRMLVVGDGLSMPPETGDGWPALVRTDLEAAGSTVEVVVDAADTAGYAEPDPSGDTFGTLAQAGGGGFDLVVLFGSRSDIAAAADVQAAAAATFAAVRAASPDAVLVVIGPAWQNGNPPGYIVTNRDALAAAVVPTGAQFVDPLAAGWFAGTSAGLVAPGGVRPTAEGHRYLADLIGPVVERALADGG